MADVSLKAQVQYTPRSNMGQFIATKVSPAAQAAVRAFQQIVVDRAQEYCPVKTGDLQRSIKLVEPDDSGKTVIGNVVAGMYYAGYVEFGTGIRGAASEGAGPYPYNPDWPGQVAQPYMRPGLDAARTEGKAQFGAIMSAGLKL